MGKMSTELEWETEETRPGEEALGTHAAQGQQSAMNGVRCSDEGPLDRAWWSEEKQRTGSGHDLRK